MTRAARFDGAALYAALDAQRTARGLTWEQLAREIGVSASTMAGAKSGGAIETDGMLAMVAWLRRAPESFTRDRDVAAREAPVANPGERFDAPALYAALDERRQARGLSWQQVALEVGLRAAQLTRLAKPCRIDVTSMLALVAWLDCTVSSFTRRTLPERAGR